MSHPDLPAPDAADDDLMGSVAALAAQIRETDRQLETGEFYKDPLAYMVDYSGQKIPMRDIPFRPLGSRHTSVDVAPQTAAEKLLSSGGGRIDRAEIRVRAGKAMLRNLPAHPMCQNHADEWAIIGGGPSINTQVDEIRRLKKRGVNIISVNKSHDWLLENGIVPWGHVLLDPMDWVADYVKRPRNDVRYFVASQCHEKTFDALNGFPVFLWHAGQDFDDGPEPNCYLREKWPTKPWFVVPGPTTVGLRTIFLGNFMAPVRPRKFHFFGLDSSRTAGKMHAYEKTEAPDAHSGNILAKHRGTGFVFSTNNHMARQWADFQKLVGLIPDYQEADLLPKNLDITFYGSGLLPFYAATLGWHSDPECNKDPAKVGGYVHMEAIASPDTLLGNRLVMKPRAA